MKKLTELRDHLREWVDRYSKAVEAAPDVQRTLDLVNWQFQAHSEAPEELKRTLESQLSYVWEREHDVAIRALPLIPRYDLRAIAAASLATASANTIAYEYLLSARGGGGNFYPMYFQRQLDSYRSIQTSQNRMSEVKDLIQRYVPQVAGQFKKAYDTVDSVRAGTLDASAAALEMRTLLDQLKGELFAKACKHAKENMTWESMAERLCRGDQAATQKATLLEQGQQRATIISRLSAIAKRRDKSNFTSLQDVWSVVLDHLYAVLRAVDREA